MDTFKFGNIELREKDKITVGCGKLKGTVYRIVDDPVDPYIITGGIGWTRVLTVEQCIQEDVQLISVQEQKSVVTQPPNEQEVVAKFQATEQQCLSWDVFVEQELSAARKAIIRNRSEWPRCKCHGEEKRLCTKNTYMSTHLTILLDCPHA